MTTLRTGQSVRLSVLTRDNSTRPIGQGKVIDLSARKLEFLFDVAIPGHTLQSHVRIQYQGSSDGDRKVRLRVDYRGIRNGRSESFTETVQADSYMLKRGILTFYYKDGRHFFQLSRDSSGRNVMVTDWGIIRVDPI